MTEQATVYLVGYFKRWNANS